MFERFTERARRVVVLAQDEARVLKHSYIGSEHLLLGLVREEEGLAARVLTGLDLTADGIRAEIQRIVGEGEETMVGQLPCTPRAKKVLELALREALSLGHNYIGTEHILLGLVRENEGVAARILLDFGTGPETIRNEIVRCLAGPQRRKLWTRPDVDLQQVWTRDAEVFRIVGIADSPTVTVENVVSRDRETFVIGSPLFAEFNKLVTARPEGEAA